MFNEKRTLRAMLDEDVPEWEEVEPGLGAVIGGEYDTPAEECIYICDEYGDSGVSYAVYRPDVEQIYSQDDLSIEIDGGAIDLSDFPALRMAYGFNDSIEPRMSEMAEKDTETGNGGDLSELIVRYAELDDDGSADAEQVVNAQEDLPLLFCVDRDVNDELTEDISNEVFRPEFTMESELEMQREISEELFEYINTIDSNARELMRSRERNSREIRASRVYDPYNLSFNSRYDDTEEVLDNTPVISMEPKYAVVNDWSEDDLYVSASPDKSEEI